MDVTLTPEAERLVRDRLRRGQYPDASALVDEAIHYLLEVDEAEAELEALVRQGIESGPAREMTSDDLDAIRRYINAKHPQPDA